MIARRYAAALADVAIEKREAEEVRQELNAWHQMLESNAELREVFANPTIPYEQKRRVLNELIARSRVRPTTATFLQLLLRNQRLPALTDISRRLEQELDERAGVVAAKVVTARPVSPETQQIIHRKIKGLTGKDIRVVFQTDDNIIGGLVTRIGSTVYDGSIRTQLDNLATQLARS